MFTFLSFVLTLTAQAASPQHLGEGYACYVRSATDSYSVYFVEMQPDRTRRSGIARVIADEQSRGVSVNVIDEQGTWQNGVAGISAGAADLNLTLINGGAKAVGNYNGGQLTGQCKFYKDVVRVTR